MFSLLLLNFSLNAYLLPCCVDQVMGECVCESQCLSGCWWDVGSSARLAVSQFSFLPALMYRNIATAESADGQKRKGARGPFSHELYTVSHF